MKKNYVAKKVQQQKITEESIYHLTGLFIIKLKNEDRKTFAKIKQNEYKQGFLDGMQLQKSINQ